MKLKKARTVEKVIKRKLGQIAKQFGVDNDTFVTLRDESSRLNEEFVGIEIRTDGDMYDLLYSSFVNPYLTATLLREIITATGLDPRKHYFENDAGGILYLF